jgi:hypothetical protein
MKGICRHAGPFRSTRWQRMEDEVRNKHSIATAKDKGASRYVKPLAHELLRQSQAVEIFT